MRNKAKKERPRALLDLGRLRVRAERMNFAEPTSVVVEGCRRVALMRCVVGSGVCPASSAGGAAGTAAYDVSASGRRALVGFRADQRHLPGPSWIPRAVLRSEQPARAR